jgi:hypothetical protein
LASTGGAAKPQGVKQSQAGLVGKMYKMFDIAKTQHYMRHVKHICHFDKNAQRQKYRFGKNQLSERAQS